MLEILKDKTIRDIYVFPFNKNFFGGESIKAGTYTRIDGREEALDILKDVLRENPDTEDITAILIFYNRHFALP